MTPSQLALGILIVVLSFAFLRKPLQWHVNLLIVSAFVATPEAVPTYLAVANVAIYPYEIVMAVMVFRLLRAGRDNGRVTPTGSVGVGLCLILGGAVLVSAIIGGFSGYPRQDILTDLRPLVDFLIAIWIAYRVCGALDLKLVLPTVRALICFSAFLVVCASVFGLKINGRSEDAQLYSTSGGLLGSTSTATRYLTPCTFLALAAVSVCVVLVLIGRLNRIDLLATLIPSLILCFLSFSRNQLVGIAAAVVFICCFALGRRYFSAVLVRLLLFFSTIAFAFLIVISLGTLGVSNSYLNSQVSSYSARVLGGLDASALSSDTSIRDRLSEDSYMSAGIDDFIVTGSGLGYAYKPASGPANSFAADRGRLYGHNFYYWFTLKAGLLGILSLLALLSFVIVRTLTAKSRGLEAVIFGSICACYTAVCFFAPMPIGFPTSLLMGVAIGGALAVTSTSRAARKTLRVANESVTL